MRTLFLYFIFFLIASTAVQANPKTFYLKNGDTITGNVLSYDRSTGIYKVQASFGVIDINDTDIARQNLRVILKTGDILTGIFIERNDTNYIIQTSFGDISLLISDIDRVDIIEEIKKSPTKASAWVFSNEEIMDLYSDPTGFTMKKNTLYISGLSWGYSLTDTFQLTTRYWDAISSGDLNLRSKWMIFKRGSLDHRKAFSIGSHIHMGGYPANKFVYQKVDNGDDTEDEESYYHWESIGKSDDTAASLWGSLFAAYTKSSLNKNKIGRLAKTIGSEITFYRNYPIMIRTYAGISYDLRKDLKLLSIISYDPYWGSIQNDQDITLPLYLDLGFIYAYNEHLRVGIHFQRYFFTIYYKF